MFENKKININKTKLLKKIMLIIIFDLLSGFQYKNKAKSIDKNKKIT